MATPTYDVFISYKSEDLALAEGLHSRLVPAGFTVWFDRARLNPGCQWHAEIEAGCEASRIILPVLTPMWATSEWCKYETYGGECVVPLHFAGNLDEIHGAAPPLAEWQAVDLTHATDATWRALFATLREYLAAPAPEKRARTADLPVSANPYFVGREAVLLERHDKLCANPTVALTHGLALVLAGLGGVGKTTLARQYAEKFWRLYHDIMWVAAANDDLLPTEFARIALQLGVIKEPSNDPQRDAARALAELERGPRRLLIIDNANDEERIQDWLPKQGECRTLVTSRFTAWSAAVQGINVHVEDPAPARELLLRRSGLPDTPENQAAADRLALELGYLPLALEQAAANIQQQNWTLDGYLEGFAQYRRDLLAKRPPGATGYPDSVATTFHGAYDILPPLPRAVLALFALLDVQNLQASLLLDQAGSELLEELLVKMGGEGQSPEAPLTDFDIRSALGELRRQSLIRLTDADGLSVHPLVLEVIRDELKLTTANKLLPLPRAIVSLAAILQLSEVPRSFLLNQVGRTLLEELVVEMAAESQSPEAPLTQLSIGEALDKLHSYCFVTLRAEGFSMNRLAQEKIRDRLTEEGYGLELRRPKPKPMVFISAKSEDYGYAEQVNQWLVDKRIPTFFSAQTLPRLGDTDYNRVIDEQIEKCWHMVVVSTSREHCESGWVRYEWSAFATLKRSSISQAKGNLTTVAVGGLKVEDLPLTLRMNEVIPFDPNNPELLFSFLG
jgi:hypothetical protein